LWRHRLDAERIRGLQADMAGSGIERKTHAEVAGRRRCAGAAGRAGTLPFRVPGGEHFNSARLFSPDAVAADAAN
jgi:hypothetical protein